MEHNIYGILVIALFVIIAVFVIENEFICTYYLAKLVERYKNGIYIGCANLEELREKLIAIIGQDVIIIDNYVLAREGNKKYIFFLENERVIAEYPVDKIGHSRASRRINSFLRIFKLNKAMSVSKIMDRIAAKYNTEFQTEESKTYVKVRRVYKGIIFTYIISVVILISIITGTLLSHSSKMIDEVKNYSPEGYSKCTYGKAFEDFFSDENWSFFRSDKNLNIVEFKGKANLNSKEVEVLVQFMLDELGHNPRVNYVEVDGKKAENYIAVSMFEEIFKDCGDNSGVVKNKKENSETKPKKEKKEKVKKKKKTKNAGAKAKSNRYSDDELVGAAMEYYRAVNGTDRISAMSDGEDGDNIKIRIFADGADAIDTLAWYTVNIYTGKGTDFWGDPIDIMNPPTTTANNYSNDEYIFPNSDSEYLTESDLSSMSSEELRIARNEIYARYGRMFKDQALQNYFNSKSWYTPSIRPEDFNEHWLNEYEKANAKLIKSFE